MNMNKKNRYLDKMSLITIKDPIRTFSIYMKENEEHDSLHVDVDTIVNGLKQYQIQCLLSSYDIPPTFHPIHTQQWKTLSEWIEILFDYSQEYPIHFTQCKLDQLKTLFESLPRYMYICISPFRVVDISNDTWNNIHQRYMASHLYIHMNEPSQYDNYMDISTLDNETQNKIHIVHQSIPFYGNLLSSDEKKIIMSGIIREYDSSYSSTIDTWSYFIEDIQHDGYNLIPYLCMNRKYRNQWIYCVQFIAWKNK